MAKAAPAPPFANDGGAVVTLFLMVAALAYVTFTAVTFYAHATTNVATANVANARERRLTRLLSAWANVGNSLVHALLVIYITANDESATTYWIKERELGGVAGPVVLCAINFCVGLHALRGDRPLLLSLGWNSFVAVSGTLVPIVWPRFINEGFTAWPHIAILLWFAIFACELTGLAASVTWFALNKNIPAKRD